MVLVLLSVSDIKLISSEFKIRRKSILYFKNQSKFI